MPQAPSAISTARPAVASMLVLVLIQVLVSACSASDDHDHPHLTTGQQLFEYHCSGCHAIDGGGLIFRRTPAVTDTDLQHSEITHKLVKGADGGRMPVFENMPRKEAAMIASYLKTRLQNASGNK